MDKLQRLKNLYEDGHLSEEEYTVRKNEIIDEMLDGGGGGVVGRDEEVPSSHAANPTRTTHDPAPAASRTTQAATGASPRGRVVVANAPPPGARVVYVDVNAPAVAGHTAKPVRVDKDGRMMCTKCGDPITTRVMEINHLPYDTVCHRIEMMGNADIKMPSTGLREAPPTRSYVNRKGERELAAIDKKNAEYEKKHGNKDAKRAAAAVAKIKAQAEKNK